MRTEIVDLVSGARNGDQRAWDALVAERHAAVRLALADLPPACQRLMAMLAVDPPVPYAEIGARLGIAVGSIGPTRARCLDQLRRHPAIAALADADPVTADPGQRR